MGMGLLTLGRSGSMDLVLLATSASSLMSHFVQRYVSPGVACWTVLTTSLIRLSSRATQSTARSNNTPLRRQLMLHALTSLSHSMPLHQSCVQVSQCTSKSAVLSMFLMQELSTSATGVSRSRVLDLANRSPLSVLVVV